MSTSKTSGCGCGGSGGVATPASGGCGCADCVSVGGGMVRPRFFAGQLLTEEDLQALSDYVVNKQRLHNRHVLGDGVVCGLQVGCDSCGGGSVTVQPGHALDCCGNDLVLDCAVELDILAMVRALRLRQRGGADCGDPCADLKPDGTPRVPGQEPQIERRYGLYLRYHERQTDPVAPYATDEPCAGGACEASRVREGVSFELRCYEPIPTQRGLLGRVLACLGDLVKAEALSEALKAMVDDEGEPTPAELVAVRDALLDQIDNAPPSSDCRLRADVVAIAIPAAGAPTLEAARRLVLAYLRLLRDCVCRALLPPCPPCDDTAVLLAGLTLSECKVTAICNLERRFVLTGPALRHWLPLDVIGDLFERLCCEPLRLREPKDGEDPQQPQAAENALTPKALRLGGTPAAANPKEPNEREEDVADAIGQALVEHLRVAFGLSQANLTQLSHIGENLGELIDFRGLDEVLPMRTLRGLADSGWARDRMARAVTGSPAFGAAVAQVDRQQAEQAKALQVVGEQNKALQAKLDALMTRVGRLEAAPPPVPPNGGEPKKPTRK